MTHVRVHEAGTERFALRVRDTAGNFLTGATDLFARVVRLSDGFALDFSDLTFKASGWTSLNSAALSEVNATAAPGLYQLAGGFDTSAWTNRTDNDDYVVIPFTTGTTADLPDSIELKVGQLAQHIYMTYVTHGKPGDTSAPALVIDLATAAGTRKLGTELDQTVVTAAGVTTVANV